MRLTLVLRIYGPSANGIESESTYWYLIQVLSLLIDVELGDRQGLRPREVHRIIRARQ